MSRRLVTLALVVVAAYLVANLVAFGLYLGVLIAVGGQA